MRHPVAGVGIGEREGRGRKLVKPKLGRADARRPRFLDRHHVPGCMGRVEARDVVRCRGHGGVERYARAVARQKIIGEQPFLDGPDDIVGHAGVEGRRRAGFEAREAGAVGDVE